MKYIFSLILSSLLFFSFAFGAQASGPFAPAGKDEGSGFEKFLQVASPGTSGQEQGLEATLPQAIGSIISLLLGFVGVIMLIITIWAGYIWLTAGGNPTKVTDAKKMISRAAIGLVLAFSAFAISSYVVDVFERAVFEKTTEAPTES